MRRSVGFFAVAVSALLSSCGGGGAETSAKTSTSTSTDRPLPNLPSAGVVIDGEKGVKFADLAGMVLAELEGLTLDLGSVPGPTPVLLREGGTGRLLALDPARSILAPTAVEPPPETPSTWPKLPKPAAPSPEVEVLGHWRWALPQPGTQRLLAQWSGECEFPIAFLFETPTSTPRAVTGQKDWSQAPESLALGWATDGRAIIQLLGGACGTGSPRPGVYLVDPATAAKTFISDARGARAWSATGRP